MRLACGGLLIAMLCACGDDGGGGGASWAVVAEDQPSSLLSVWGSSATDVWAVGGDPRTGTGPLVMHYDGETWTKLDTGLRNIDLWWVFGFAGGPVFMSGSNGTIVRYQNGTFEKLTTPGTFIVFGMWGAAPDDMWAVGGNFGGSGFAWRYDGRAWTEFPNVPPDIMSQGTCWKVNGRGANDVWISATLGTTLHWDGATLERVDVPVEASLLSIAGNSKRFVTVGGAFDGLLFENDGSGWKSALPAGGPLLTGVAVSEDQAYAVGQFGTILRRGDSGWSTEKPRMTNQNLHATWIDPSGGAWAVGGHFDTPPMSAGVLLHKGEPLRSGF
ncbi:MAG TPA: hypothetical protein VN253_23060 [Kofleriaceae bacterium]|nr:hypothetical protein [Kofleriaceae bacterium]